MLTLQPDDWVAIRLSLKVAATATLFSLPLGIAVAFALARGRFYGRTMLDGIVHLPLVLPPVVIGYLLLIHFGRQGVFGAFLEANLGLVFSFRWTGAALACAVMGFPLLVQPIRLTMESIDVRLEQAASTLGASPVWVFFTITLPLSLPGIVAGAVLCFAKALGEFGATITFVSNIPGETQTIPSAVHTYISSPDGDAGAIRLSLVSLILAFAALLASQLIVRRFTRAKSGGA
ncbi:MAG: molybdate ABC transporter permease subunit [Hyphomicrobiaceae bacterium]